MLCAPGNPGIARCADLRRVDIANTAAVLELAARERVDLTVVGPELPLERGIVDTFRADGRAIIGPARFTAQLETSKVFAKDFCARHRVPTARYRACTSADEALSVLARGEFGFPVVLKADGLAGGKGVVIAADAATAEHAVKEAMVARQFGDAGARLVIEEFMEGTEASFFVLCDGRTALPLSSAQDHKRIFDNDHGPNTGGMGAFSPSPLVTSAIHERVMREIVSPVLDGLRSEGHEYTGFLYVGLMLTAEGPKVVEFNVRFGDPEAQVILPRIEGDLGELLAACAGGRLDRAAVAFSPRRLVGVVLASRGYPASSQNGVPIHGVESAESSEDVLVFHAGTSERDGKLVTHGGRVLTVVGRGDTYEQAIANAYEGVSRISFDGMQYRRDIGQKALGQIS